MEASFDMPAIDALIVTKQIRAAFDARHRPNKATESSELTKDEQAALAEIMALDWRDTTASKWEKLADVVSWLSPEGFCYYLPGILVSTLEERCPNLMAACSVLFMLDRTPAVELWDDFFLERWRRFTVAELEAIATWIDWVSTEDGVVLDDVALTRALLNIDLLVSLAQENKG
ncbi:DUF6714 family protein [Ralstonia solanacearum species complex bacterium KE056]|uniref:DUF6714 family protein n=1 Tax=Ralstonia solanacearum species complex bacterium KE056 TaxID=3119585 RepID=UPI002FC2B0A8